MNVLKKILSLVFCLFSMTVQADHFPVGTEVLADCHGFFSKGVIKRLYKEQFVVNFYKDSRPVLCPPFAWDGMFLVAYKPVFQIKGKLKDPDSFFGGTIEETFRVGDKLKIDFKATSKGALFSNKYQVTVAIKEINANAAAQLEIIAGDEVDRNVFNRWVGSNFVSLDFSSTLTADRLTILEVEKLD